MYCSIQYMLLYSFAVTFTPGDPRPQSADNVGSWIYLIFLYNLWGFSFRDPVISSIFMLKCDEVIAWFRTLHYATTETGCLIINHLGNTRWCKIHNVNIMLRTIFKHSGALLQLPVSMHFAFIYQLKMHLVWIWKYYAKLQCSCKQIMVLGDSVVLND